ncbi:hypothetical protein [Catenovulum sediminis]|uniref:hypothetical protein n=1 Tax=Catenovulum sediminis TaxID=1740262 RepID=UPI00117E7CAF|nr:hypothetical protein [Catenovulum sediminis]
MKHLQQMRSVKEHFQGLATQMPHGKQLDVRTVDDGLIYVCLSAGPTPGTIIAEKTFDFNQPQAHDAAMDFAARHLYSQVVIGMSVAA